MIYKDQLDRTVLINATPKRIVSLVPSQTELLVHLGLADAIVGVTKFCVHPSTLRKEKIIVGGTKTVHFNKITALNPDVIICNKEENTKEIVEACTKIAPVWVSNVVTLDDNNLMILLLSKIFNKEAEAVKLVSNIQTAQADFLSFMENKPLKKVAYCIWKNPYMVAGNDTFINCLLRLNKFENIFENKDGRYPEVLKEDLKTAEVVLLSSEPFPFNNKHVQELKNELRCEVRLVDGEYFSWYGSRLKDAFKYFKSLHL